MATKKLSIERRNEISDKLFTRHLLNKGLQFPSGDESAEELKKRAEEIGVSVEELQLFMSEKIDFFVTKMKEKLLKLK
jgi:hypothetical protein